MGYKDIALAGGVSANSELRKRFSENKEFNIYFPELKYCGDNAAMMGVAAAFESERADSSLNAFATMDITK